MLIALLVEQRQIVNSLATSGLARTGIWQTRSTCTRFSALSSSAGALAYYDRPRARGTTQHQALRAAVTITPGDENGDTSDSAFCPLVQGTDEHR